MSHKGSCHCGQWKVSFDLPQTAENLNPRVCDCDYCKSNDPAKIISDPSMSAEFEGGSFVVRQNGDQLANFYYCDNCNQLLAIGSMLGGSHRGAINGGLFSSSLTFGQTLQVQPRLLSAEEKLERWDKLWGKLNGL